MPEPGDLYRHLTSEAAKHNQQNGAPTAQATDQLTNYVCPTCNKDEALLIQKPRGGLICRMNSEHRWLDLTDIKPRPRMVAVPQQVTARSIPGATSLSILVHQELKDQLTKRFGISLDPTLTTLCQALLDSDAYLVTGPDAAEISNMAGKRVFGCSALKGYIRAVKQEYADTKEALEKLEAQKGTSGPVAGVGQVVINLGPGIKEIQAKADAKGQSLSEFLSEQIWFGHKNEWF